MNIRFTLLSFILCLVSLTRLHAQDDPGEEIGKLANNYVEVTISDTDSFTVRASTKVGNDFYFFGNPTKLHGNFQVKYAVKLLKSECVLKVPKPPANTVNTGGGLITPYLVEAQVAGEKKVMGNVYVLPIDLDIDSDNTNKLAKPDRSEKEEKQEDSVDPSETKVIISHSEVQQGIPGWADGFDINPGETFDDSIFARRQFTPLVVYIPTSKLKDVDPEDVIVTFKHEKRESPPKEVKPKLRPKGEQIERQSKYKYFHPKKKGFRIWNKQSDGKRVKESINDGGNYIVPEEEISWDILAKGKDEVTLYIENVDGAGVENITIDVEILGKKIAKLRMLMQL